MTLTELRRMRADGNTTVTAPGWSVSFMGAGPLGGTVRLHAERSDGWADPANGVIFGDREQAELYCLRRGSLIWRVRR